MRPDCIPFATLDYRSKGWQRIADSQSMARGPVHNQPSIEASGFLSAFRIDEESLVAGIHQIMVTLWGNNNRIPRLRSVLRMVINFR
jgi:hypothetical protein